MASSPLKGALMRKGRFWHWMGLRRAARAILSVPLLFLAGILPCQEDAADLLKRMAATTRSAGSLHLAIEVQERPLAPTDAPAAAPLQLTAWIDAVKERTRVEVRSEDRPAPHLTFVTGPDGLIAYHADARQCATLPTPLSIEEAIEVSAAGELLLLAYTGRLGAMRAASYEPAVVVGAVENVGGSPCTTILFGGNQEARLWLGVEDHLPRRLEGCLPGRRRHEEVRALEIGAPLSESLFELQAVTAAPTIPFLLARQQWTKLPPQRSRWPAVGTIAPAIGATDLEGTAQRIDPGDSTVGLLVFWFHANSAITTAMAAAEEAWLDAGHDEGRMVSLHHGLDVDAVATIAAERALLHRVRLVDPRTSGHAFERYWIASCPVFFLLEEDGTVWAATRDLDELRARLGSEE